MAGKLVVIPDKVNPVSSGGSSRSESASSLRRHFSWLRAREQVIQTLLFCCSFLSIVTTLGIIYVLVTESLIAIPPQYCILSRRQLEGVLHGHRVDSAI